MNDGDAGDAGDAGDDGDDGDAGDAGDDGDAGDAGDAEITNAKNNCGNRQTEDINMDHEQDHASDTTDDEKEHDDGFEKSVEHVEDNMPFICICIKATTNTINAATQTNLQNTGQPPESNPRIPLRPERQIMKQKTLLAKNNHTIRKMEHSLNVKTSQLDRLRKQNTELKNELNLRWRELTTSRATHNNDKRKLNEAEARLQESIKTNRWCTRTKHDFFNLHIDPPMTIRLSYRQTLSNVKLNNARSLSKD